MVNREWKRRLSEAGEISELKSGRSSCSAGLSRTIRKYIDALWAHMENFKIPIVIHKEVICICLCFGWGWVWRVWALSPEPSVFYGLRLPRNVWLTLVNTSGYFLFTSCRSIKKRIHRHRPPFCFSTPLAGTPWQIGSYHINKRKKF